MPSYTLKVTNGSIHCEILGQGHPVILIHGGFGDRRMWDQQFQELAAHYLVVRYDHRGFGRSSFPDQLYSPVEDLLRLMEELKIQQAHVVGNSIGGSLALDFALQYPERVNRMVLVAAGPNGYPVPEKHTNAIGKVFETAQTDSLDRAVELWLANPMVAISSRQPGVKGHLRVMILENRQIFRLKHWPEEDMNPPAAERLNEIRVPTMVIFGEEDIALVREMGEIMAKRIPGAEKIILREADHLPQMNRPRHFNQSLFEFLERI